MQTTLARPSLIPTLVLTSIILALVGFLERQQRPVAALVLAAIDGIAAAGSMTAIRTWVASAPPTLTVAALMALFTFAYTITRDEVVVYFAPEGDLTDGAGVPTERAFQDARSFPPDDLQGAARFIRDFLLGGPADPVPPHREPSCR